MKYSNENILRSSLDPREWGPYLETEIERRKKIVEAPNADIALALFAAEECPEEDPNVSD